MFKVPEEHRLKKGPLQSHPEHGNNGMFIFLSPFDETNNTKFVCIASDQLGWDHVSVQVTMQGSMTGRMPTWEEMCFIKDLFWSDDECVVQYHPPKSEYVNFHPHVLHLWRPNEGPALPMPPSFMVGPKSDEAKDIDGFLEHIAKKLAERLAPEFGENVTVEIRNGNEASEPFTFETVAGYWEEFSAKAVPSNAGPGQIRDMRTCFYAGVLSMFAQVSRLGDDDVPEYEAVEQMQRFKEELEQYTLMFTQSGEKENGNETH